MGRPLFDSIARCCGPSQPQPAKCYYPLAMTGSTSPLAWLVKRNGAWGCVVCAAALNLAHSKAVSHNQDTSRSRYVAFAHVHVTTPKTGSVRRHEQCKAHKSAMQAAGLLTAASQDDVDVDDAPSADTIMRFWQSRKQMQLA